MAKVARMLKAIHAREDATSALAKNAEVVTKWKAMKLTRAADGVATSGHETLTYFAFPTNHWRQIKTNNPLERIIVKSDAGRELSEPSQTAIVR